MTDDGRLYELMDLFFSGKISNEDAKELLTYLQSHSEANRFFLSNVEADFYLEQAVRGCVENASTIYTLFNENPPDHLKANSQSKEEEEKKEVEVPAFTTAEEFFSEMVQYEKDAKPIREETVPEPPKPTLLQKWFLPKSKSKSNSSEPEQTKTISVRSRRRSNYFFVGRLLLFITFIGWLCFQANDKSRTNPVSDFKSVGRMTEIVDAVWGKDSPAYKRGQPLGSEHFTLETGMAKVVLNSGVELILESPGNYSITDAMNCYCEWGKVSAHVPKNACGFEIISPLGRFIDRGTDFYLDVQPDKTDMGVVRGQVDYAQQDGTFLPIKKGREIRVPKAGTPHVSLCSATRYLDSKHFVSLLDNYFSRWNQEKAEKVVQWDSHPCLLVWLDMNREGKGKIPNLSVRGRGKIASAMPDSIVTQSGMIPACRAWNFNENSFVRLEIPGQYESFSLMANIQINPLPNMVNVLFCSEDMVKTKGAMIWQITKEGVPQLQISNGNQKANEVYISPVQFTNKDWGTWVNIAVVVDAKRKRVRHYIDGKMISSTPWKKPVPVTPGVCLIGNANTQQTNNKYHLGCPMADFFAFDYPMTENDFEVFMVNPGKK